MERLGCTGKALKDLQGAHHTAAGTLSGAGPPAAQERGARMTEDRPSDALGMTEGEGAVTSGTR